MFKTVKKVARHSAVYGLGDLLTKAVGFLLIPLYTHYLSTEDYGVLALIDLTSMVIANVVGLGICFALMRIYFDYKSVEDRDKVVSVALVTIWLVSALGLLLLLGQASAISQLVFETPIYRNYFYIVFVSLALSLCNEIPLTLLQIEQKSVFYTTIALIRSAIQLTLNIVFIVYFGYGIFGIFLSTLIVNSITAVFLLIYTLRRIHLSFSFKILGQLLHFGIPLIGTSLGAFFLHYCDAFLLQRFATLSAVGIYALSYKFGFLLNTLLLAPFSRSWLPMRFEIAAEEDAPKTYTKVFNYFCLVWFFLALGISVIIKDVIEIIAEQSYHSAYLYVPVLLLAYACYAAFRFFEFGILYRKKTRFSAYLTIFSALLNVVCNILLIPRMGIWGAAWSTLFSFAFLAAATLLVSQKLYYIPFEFGRIGKMLLLAVALYVVCMFIEIDNLLISIVVRGGIACFFPFLLLPLGVYGEDEKEKIGELWRERKNWRGWIRGLNL